MTPAIISFNFRKIIYGNRASDIEGPLAREPQGNMGTSSINDYYLSNIGLTMNSLMELKEYVDISLQNPFRAHVKCL